jgi:hypothetical protein
MRLLATCLLVAIVSALAACSKLTMDHYNRVKLGMSYEEVRQILGAPERCSEALTIRNCEWGDEKRWARVNFVGDKVVLTSADNLR